MIDRTFINIKNSCSDCIWKATKMCGHTADCVRNMNSTYMKEDQRWLGTWNTLFLRYSLLWGRSNGILNRHNEKIRVVHSKSA